MSSLRDKKNTKYLFTIQVKTIHFLVQIDAAKFNYELPEGLTDFVRAGRSDKRFVLLNAKPFKQGLCMSVCVCG